MAEENDRYKYDPSMVAAVIFIVLFSLSGVYHVFQVIKLRSWYFIPFIIGCAVEAIGYGGRAINAGEESGQWTELPFLIQALLLLLGPPFFAASIYMVLGRLIRLLDAERYSMIRLKWLTKIFLFGDIASIVAQGIGGGMLAGAKSKSDSDRGQAIIIGGLAIQLLFFGGLMVVTVMFHLRIRHDPTDASLKIQSPWKKLLVVLYATSLLIMVRSVFRVIEYIMGKVVTLLLNGKSSTPNVEYDPVLAYTAFGHSFQWLPPFGPKFESQPEHRKALVRLYETLPQIIHILKPIPTIELKHGFEGILEGLDELRAGRVVGGKQVVRFP